MDFVAIDFETANEDLTSVCQIGIACFKSGQLADTYISLVNPNSYFSAINESIHGITEKDVKNAPSFTDVYGDISNLLDNQIVVSHTHFDRSVWYRTTQHHALQSPEIFWLDSAKVVRRTWDKYAKSGYGLSNVANDLQIDFKHHDALEDAKTAGMVLMRACEHSGLNVKDWLEKTKQPITTPSSVQRVGNNEGLLYGETIVFTGALAIPRREAADIAAAAGCDVGSGVTKNTTLLVVGDQDIQKLKPDQTKSSKHLKAEKLIEKGQDIKIIQESDFLKLVQL